MQRALVMVMLLMATSAFGEKALTLSDGVKDLASNITAGLKTQHRQRVGITAFTDVHTRAKGVFGSYLAESITTRLVVGGLDVVERLEMEKVIAQLNIESSRVIDKETAKRVGKQAGVEAIVIGTIADMGAEVEINARVIDIETGHVLTAAVTTITRDTMVSAMLGGPVKAVVAQPAPVPARVAAPEDDGVMSWTVAGTRIVIDEASRPYPHVIRLALAFENNGTAPVTVRARVYHLVDENGDRYRYEHDSERFVSQGVTIAPETRARSNFEFRCSGECNGQKFTLLDSADKIILRNILVGRE
jgi:TolB-like protein